MGLWGVDSRSMAIALALCSGDLQRITGGLLTEMALVMPRTDRRAYILLCMVPGRGDPSVRCRRCDHRLVLTETRQALLMELRIGNRTTLFAHARLAESAVCFEEPIVTFALDADEMVRQSPERAYDIAFFDEFARAAGWTERLSLENPELRPTRGRDHQ